MIKTLKSLVLTGIAFFACASAHAISLSVTPGSLLVESGVDCELATYRMQLNEAWNGQQLDLLVEVIDEDNDFDGDHPVLGDQCVHLYNGVFSISLKDTDAGDDMAFVDTVFTVVARGTTTPVFVDRITVTGFDLDDTGGTGTDDIYLSGAGATYLSGSTLVQYNEGSFPGGHDVHMRGSLNGNCLDGVGAVEPDCRAAATWTGGSSNQISTFNARFQNDNAYGQSNNANALRLLQLSLEDQHAQDLFDAISDHGDAANSFGTAHHPQISMQTILGYGLAPDHDANHQASATADGDDSDVSGLTPNYDDEDGIFRNGTSLQGQVVAAGVNEQLDVVTFGTGYLSGWVDLNHDGDFLDAGEHVLSDVHIVSDTVQTTQVSMSIPLTATGGPGFARFRFDENPGLSHSGPGSKGEVEDYYIQIDPMDAQYNMVKSSNTPTMNAAGLITYTFEFINTGNVPLSNLTVSDPNIDAGTLSGCPIATLPVGQTASCTATRTVSQSIFDAGAPLTNTATPSADDPLGSAAPETTTADNSTQTTLSLSYAKSIDKPAPVNADDDGNGEVSLGDTLTYTVTVTNTGAGTLTNVQVTDNLITPSATTCASVTPGATCVLVGTYVVTAADVAAGVVDNVAEATSDQTGVLSDPESVAILAPALALDKAAPTNADGDGNGAVSAGDVLTYAITATNTGASTLTNVVVNDPMLSPGTETCGTLAPLATCVLTGQYTVTAADVTAGQIVNTASVDSDQTSSLTDTETVPVPVPALALDKPAPVNGDGDASGDVTVGDVLTYTITALNNGATALTNVVVSDPLIVPSSNTCAYVAVGDSCQLVGTYIVTAADVTAGSIPNTATANSDQIGPLDANQVVPVAQPGLALDKAQPTNADEDGSGDFSVGDTLTYVVTSTNSGGTNLTSVVVNDPMLTPASTTCATLAPGATCVLTGTYSVTAADVAAGSIVNTADSDSDQTGPVDDTETVTLNTPALALDKTAPANNDADGSGDVSAGDVLTYTITATNSGTATLTNVVVTDSLVTPNTISCAVLAPGATCVLIGDYTVVAADVSANTIVNTADADADQTGPVDDTETVLLPTPALVLSKGFPDNNDQDGSGDFSAGDTLSYTIIATNSGTATLTNVVVSDPLIVPASTTCALLTPGATCILTGDYTATAADVVAGQINNTASVVSDQTSSIDDTQSVSLNAPSHAMDKAQPTNADEDGSTDISEGDTLTYTITATNNGAATLTNLIVSDPMLTPGSITCATVAPNATCVLTGDYIVKADDVIAGSIVNTATSDSDQTDLLNDTETVTLPTPALALDKAFPVNNDMDGTGDVSAGDVLTYTITATNTGSATLTNLVVSDPLIAPTTNTCASVAPSATCVLTGAYTVTAADVAAGTIDNTATANADQTGPIDDSQAVSLNQPSHAMDKAAPANADEDGSSDISVGDTLTYTITATNTGAATLTNLVVSDPMITPTTNTCAVVAPSATCVLTGTYVVTAADVTAGSIVNTATSDSDQTDPLNDTETVPVPTPSLALDKAFPVNGDQDSTGDISVGDVLTYTITATNTGTATLTNLVVSDPLIAPTTTSCATVATGATCVLTGTYTVTAADVAAGTIDNTATADSDQTGPIDDSQTVSLNQPSHAMDKAAPANADEDGSSDISVGDTLTYTITATNTGAAALTNLVVSDPMITPTTNTCAVVAPSATCVLTGTYVVTAADVTAGSIVNTATSDSDQTDPLNDTETVPVPTPSLALDKAFPVNGDQDATGDISAGDVLTYTITATNTGTATLTNLVVSDPLVAPTTNTCALVAPSATCVLTGAYTVTAADVAAGTIDNTATADSDQTGPIDDSQTVSLNQPSHAMDKVAPINADEDGSGDISVGDTLTYTITATNTGAATLTNLVVSDPMITPTTNTCAVVAPSATCVLTGTYVVTAADVSAGSIVNTATSDSDQTDPLNDTETVPVPTPMLALDKAFPVNGDQDTTGDISAGDVLTYTITATNTGSATLTNLIVNDPMITPTTNTCATVAPTATCVLIGTYTVTAADVAAGTIDNTATADSDQAGPVDDVQSVKLDQPAHALDKAAPVNADEDGSGDISVGDTLTYTITATNTGAATLTNLVVSDPMITPTANTCASVAPSATCVLTGSYVVTAADVTAGSIVNTASSDSDQTDPLTDTETVPVPAPSLALDKAIPVNGDQDATGDISVGDVLTYTITATNSGTATLTNLVVSDPLIAPSTTTCATVASGATCVLTGTYTVTAADVAAGTIDNTATADSDQTDPLSDTETVPVPTPSLALDKAFPVNGDQDATGDISAGDVLTYTITATNTGTATLTNLVVNDPMITPTTNTCASVAPSAICVLTGTYTVTAADVAAGTIDNTATADSDQTGPVDDVQNVVLDQPAHALDKAAPVNADEDGSGDVSVGDTLTYTITATNTGAATLTNLVVSDPMITPNTNTCAAVAPSATCVLTGSYVVTAADVTAGSIVNTATSDSDQTDPLNDTETVPVPTPLLALDKAFPVNGDQDATGDISVGDVLTYTITATNTGTATLTNLVVSDPLIAPTTNTCASVAPSATCVLTGTYTVTAADVAAGTIDNTATADSDQAGPVDDVQSVKLDQPAYALDKVAPVNADEDGSGDISVGDTLTYTITATNTGAATLTNLVVSDPMITPNTNTCAAVAPSATCVLTGSYVVTAADVTAGSIVNTATSDSDQTDPLNDTETVPVPTPSFALDKAFPVNGDQDSSGDVSAGDVLTYTVTATSTGTATLTNLVVSDPLIAPNTTTCASVAPGGTCVLTGTYTVTAADVALGQIDNTATADSDQTAPLDDLQSVMLNAPALSLDKAIPVNADEDGSTDVSIGDTLTYTITATNSGSSNLTGVVVNDPMLTPSSANCATVVPGATCVLTGTYVVVAADVAAGQIDNTATADSDQTSQLADTEVVNVPTPAHALDKSVPTNADEDGSLDISAGDTLTYTITATNTGNATLTNLVVSDPMIAPNSITCAVVAPGGTCVLTGNYSVTAADVAAGQIVNIASSVSDQTGPIDDDQTVPLNAPAMALDKTAPVNADEDGSTDVSVGDTLTYTVTATNNGTSNLTNLVVSDPMLTPATFTCASVAPNGTCVLTGTYVVTAADVTAGAINNTATAVSDQTASLDDSEVVPVPAPSHTLVKAMPVNADEDGSGDISAGDTLSYTITASNDGTAVLTTMVVSDPMITPTSNTCAMLAPAATCVLAGTYTVTAADVAAAQIDNTATSDTDQTDPVDASQSVVLNAPSLALDKSAPVNTDEDGSTDVSVADTLTYTVTATNNGSSNLTAVVVNDPMLSPDSVTCASVSPGGTCVLTGVYSVTAADVQAGTIVNTATANSNQTAELSDTETVPVPMPSHSLTKAMAANADEDGSTDISAGDTLSYSVTATNDGTAVLTTLVVSDPMITPSTATCAQVLPTATCVLSGTYSVTAADIAAGQIVNTATSNTDQTGPETADNTITLNAPALTMDKTAPVNADEDGTTDVSVGDTLTYTVTATNSGSSTLTNVVVNDPMLTPDTVICATVAQGATCVLTGTYTVVAGDVTAGSITNTATANSDQTGPAEDTEVVPVPAPSHTMVKSMPVNADEDSSSDISVGDTLTYTVTATNDGAAVLTNLLVNDPMLSPSSMACATVLPGDTCVLTGTYTVAANDVVAGQIDNTATSDSDQTDLLDASVSLVLDAPSLALDKVAPVNADEDGSTDVSAADTLTYTVTATNNGGANLTNVVVSDPLLTPDTINCANVAPSGTCVLVGTYVVTSADVAAGGIDNTAVASSDQTGSIDDSEFVPVPMPSHALSKAMPVNADEDGSSDISVGDSLTYTVTATNDGAAVLTNMVVSDPLITPSTITCASVAPTATCVLSGSYVVTAADVAAGQIVNTANSDTDQTGPQQADQTVTLNAPALSLVKAAPVNADEDGSSDVSAGDTLTYTITATNNGSSVLTNVVVSDPLLAPAAANCATLAVGDDCVLTGTYVVTASDVAAGQIDNTASAVSDQTGAQQDSHSLPLNPPVLALVKGAPVNSDEDGSGDVSVGDTLTYTVTATNNGSANLTGVVVSDPLLTPNSMSCAVVAPADTCVLTGVYTVTGADVSAGVIDNTATADSNQTDPVTDDHSLPLGAPMLALDKSAPVNTDEDGSTDISVGDTLTYTVTATNNGGSNLTNLVVNDPMLSPDTFTCASVASGATCVLTGVYSVTLADVAAGTIDNTATADSDQTASVSDSETVPVPAPGFVLSKSLPANADEDKSGDISVGDTLTYTVTATNNNTAVLTNLVVSDPRLTPATISCASVAPGAVCTLTGDYTVSAADLVAGVINNTATADSDQTDPLDAIRNLTLNAPALSLVKSAPVNSDEDGSNDVSVNDTLTYTITATNNGTSNLTNVLVSDALINPSSQNCASLLPGANCVLTGVYTVTVADVVEGVIDNIASADSDQTGPLEDTHTLPVSVPGLSLVKSVPQNADEDGSSDVSAGDTLGYTITATNSGSANLTNLVVTDSLINPSSKTCALVAPGESCVLNGVYVVASEDAAAGRIVNTASADSDQIGPVEDTVTVTVPPPAITLVKSLSGNADEDGSGDVTVGDTLTYLAVASNNGSAVLTNVEVVDPMLTPERNLCATLAPQETCELTGTYQVTAADVTAGGIVNTATANSDQLDPIADSHTLSVATPQLTIVKSDPVIDKDVDSSGNVTEGDVLTYTITATNEGGTALTDVVVSDPMITPASETCALLPMGSSCVLTGQYTVAANDASAGGIVNTATADSVQTDPVADSNTVAVIVLLPPVTTDNSKTDQPLGQPVTIDVLADDSDPENNIDPTTVTIVHPDTGEQVTTLVVAGEGTWQVDPATGAITFTPETGYMDDPTPILYSVTDTTGLVSNISKVTIDYEAAASLTGTVWLDVDRDGEIDPSEPIKPGWTLEIVDANGNVVATTVTDADGKYSVEGLIPGEYTVKFYNDAGVFMAESTTGGAIEAGATIDLPLPIDPAGVVYDSITREPVPGVLMQLANSAGVAVDPVCLNTNQQNQTTGADGLYAFDVFPDAHPSCPDGETYTIVLVEQPATYVQGLSENIPPVAAVFDSAVNEADCTVDAIPQSGACEVQANLNAPQNGEDTRYYMAFTLTSGDSNVIFNHIPIDPVIVAANANMRLNKTVSKSRASVGDVLYYTVIVENEDIDAAEGVAVTDDLPRGFRFVQGSANTVTLDENNEVVSQMSIDTTGTDPVIFSGLTVPAVDTGVIAINYAVRVGAGIVSGSYVNTAEVTAGGTSNVGEAAVQLVSDPVLHQATLLGKVFHDRDSDGYQEDAYASNITVKSDYFGWSSLRVGDIPGRRSAQDPLSDHQIVVNMPLSQSNRFEVTTAEGSYLSIDDNQLVTESHTGMRARGMTAQDIRISTRIVDAVPTPSDNSTSTDVTRVLQITITNAGVDEEGLPGVRLASVSGLLVESDQFGRFHVPDTGAGEFAEGQQYILKIDTTTLPAGAVMTTENPRVMRLTDGGLNIMNFGVVLPQAEPVMASAQPLVEREVQVALGSVFFDTDKHNIRDDQRGVMRDIINKLRTFKRGRVVIAAHTDRRQTKEYNIALAKRRARTVERELRRILGDDVMNQVVVEVDSSSYTEASPTVTAVEPLETEK